MNDSVDGYLAMELGLYPEDIGESWKSYKRRDVRMSALGHLMPSLCTCPSLSLEPTSCPPFFLSSSNPSYRLQIGHPFL